MKPREYKKDVHQYIKDFGESFPENDNGEIIETFFHNIDDFHERKTVVRLSPRTNEFATVFPSLSEAARWLQEDLVKKNKYVEIDILKKAIRDCCNNKRMTAYDYSWQFFGKK